jgi:hypothetical protein
MNEYFLKFYSSSCEWKHVGYFHGGRFVGALNVEATRPNKLLLTTINKPPLCTVCCARWLWHISQLLREHHSSLCEMTAYASSTQLTSRLLNPIFQEDFFLIENLLAAIFLQRFRYVTPCLSYSVNQHSFETPWKAISARRCHVPVALNPLAGGPFVGQEILPPPLLP